jgi:DNA-binding Lrp family transcriptional regulator
MSETRERGTIEQYSQTDSHTATTASLVTHCHLNRVECADDLSGVAHIPALHPEPHFSILIQFEGSQILFSVFAMKLTATQKQILDAVVLQANKSAPEIARELGLRVHVVRRGIASLLEQGVFLRRSIWVNPHALGLNLHIVQIELPLKSMIHREAFLRHLVALDETCVVAELGGEGLFEVRILATGRGHLDSLFQSLAQTAPTPFRIRSCLTVLEQDYSGTSEPGSKKRSGASLHFGALSPGSLTSQLDEKDHIILSTLANLRYLNFQEVSRAVKLPSATLTYRVEKLEQAGIIKGHFYVMDPKVFKETPIALQIRSRVLTQKERIALMNFCRAHPRISLVTFLLGEHSIEIFTLVHEHKEVQSVIADLSLNFGDLLESSHMVPQISFHKYTMYPFRSYPNVRGIFAGA